MISFMSKNPEKRRCSAICRNGEPCQAWAVMESDPPLCPAHAGLQRGAGAPNGNQNALKHGLYAGALKAEDLADLEMLRSTSLAHELMLMRVGLLRAARYLGEGDLSLADLATILPVMSTTVRTVAYLLSRMEGSSFDWDEVLDEIKEDWGIEI